MSFKHRLEKLRTEINSLIGKKDTFGDVRYRYDEYMSLWKKYVDDHNKYLESNPSEAIDSALLRDYNEEVMHCAHLEELFETWKDCSEERKSENYAPSLFGSNSERSCTRSTKSNLSRKKEKLAMAELNVKKLKRQQDISKRIQELEMEREIIEAESKLEEAKLSVETLTELEDEKPVVSIDKPIITNNVHYNPFDFSNVANSPYDKCLVSPSVNCSAPIVSATVSNNNNSPVSINDDIAYNNIPISSAHHSNFKSQYVPPEFYRNNPTAVNRKNPIIAQPNYINNDNSIVLMEKLCQVMSTPKLEYLTFDGSPKRYTSFIHNFEECLEKSNADESRRLQLLIQHCLGKARESVESCVNLPPDIGYKTARLTLYENFGRPHVIAKDHIESLKSLPTLRNADSISLLEFTRHLEIAHRTLSGMGDDYRSELDHTNTLLFLNSKLPFFLKAKWAEKAGRLIYEGRKPKFIDFVYFIKERANLVNNEFGDSLSSSYSKENKFDNAKKLVNNVKRHVTTLATGIKKVDSSFDRINCELCNEPHPLWRCPSFKSKSNPDKAKIVFDKQLCIKCLAKGHRIRQCPKKNFKCFTKDCGKEHNTLLHGVEFKSLSRPSDRPAYTKSNDIPSTTTAATGAGVKRVCLGIVPVKVSVGNSRSISTYALLDTGSELSLILESLVENIGSYSDSDKLTLIGVTGSAEVRSRSVPITVKSLDEQTVVVIDGARTVSKLPISKSCVPTWSDVKKWSHLSDLPFKELDNLEVGLIIGVREIPHLFVPTESRVGKVGEPVALKYSLGWMILGPVCDDINGSSFSVNFIGRNTATESDDLKVCLKRLWSTDFGDIGDDKVCLSIEDRKALNTIENGLNQVEKHFQVPLPWKRDPPYLPNNRFLVENRLKGLKKRLTGNPILYDKYRATIEDYIEKGHAVRIPDSEIDVKDRPVWYLPHHPVVHPAKKDKVRVVFDCAAKFNGTSLNDQILQGPDLANKLLGVLLRFRQGTIGIVADIEAMFHQVLVDPKDFDAFRFLWFENSELGNRIVEFRMVKHIFGATSSPCIANYCLRKATELYKDEYDADTVQTILRNMYVDDLMKAVNSVNDAIKLATELPGLLSKCGFRLTKWCSNDRRVLSAVPESERAKSVVDLELDHLPTENTLGLKWNTETDCFVLKVPDSVSKFGSTKVVTKRNVLSVVASLFDPVGFIGPYIMKGKLILQMASRKKLGWDDALEESDRQQWFRWIEDMKRLPDIEISRCMFPKNSDKFKCIQLHIFADASRVGYSAVAYLRFVDISNKISCSFVVGKCRLAPIKEISIPRLELSAAIISINLKKVIFEELDTNIDSVTYWTDSRSVIKSINNESRRFHTFESNRLTLIHASSDVSEWRWVNREDNPADDGSKGLKIKSTMKNNRWINGPEFLLKEEEYWPEMIEIPVIKDGDPEIRKEAVIYVSSLKENALNKLLIHFSSWWKLKRAVAWYLRLKMVLLDRIRAKKGQQQPKSFPSNLTVPEILNAETEIVKLIQQEEFPDALTVLKNKELETKKSTKSLLREIGASLYKLNPYLQQDVMYVGGRLCNAPVDDRLKHPALLPYRHFVTDLIISDCHNQVGHLGQESVLSLIRQKFWIIKCRAAVRRVLSKCIDCQKRTKKPEIQMMSDLPNKRLIPDKPPFTYVGIDYFGPLSIKQGRSVVKRYGCLFSCFNSRAIHIEVAHSLSTDSMINCLRRFISLRGYPAEIFSDNGSNFTSSDKELSNSLKCFDHLKLSEFCLKKDITWHFNPPAASHMGGVWERMIRSVRQILKALLKEQLVCDEVLLTVLSEVVYILNNRPLTRNSNSSLDDMPLTPNHLLHLRPCASLPPGVFQKEDLYIRRKWRQAQYISQVFWKRWVSEYLPTLIERSKWQVPKRNIAINDVVLLVDEKYPRGQWPLAIVTEVLKSKDGLVRTVKLRTKSTVATAVRKHNKSGYKVNNGFIELIRPVTKVCLLEME